MVRCILALLLAGCVSAAQADDVRVEQNLVYGNAAGEELKLDLFSPAARPDKKLPALLLIHGGGWSSGGKHEFAEFAKAAARHGYVCATINYRLAPKHIFPAQVEDTKCAVRWLHANADRLNIDAGRIGAVGGSAGAHLAMMLGVMNPGDGLEGDGGNPDQPSQVKAVVALFGPTNFLSEMPVVTRGIVAGFLGGSQKDKPDVYRQASPITYVSGGDAPTLIYQGTRDPLVPHDQAVQMADALSNAGVPGRVELLLGAGHGWGGKDLERTVRDSLEFLDRYLKP